MTGYAGPQLCMDGPAETVPMEAGRHVRRLRKWGRRDQKTVLEVLSACRMLEEAVSDGGPVRKSLLWIGRVVFYGKIR